MNVFMHFQVQIKKDKNERVAYLSGLVKDAVKQLATNRYRAGVKSLLQDKGIRKIIISEVQRVIQREATHLVMQSGFRSTKSRDVKFINLHRELKESAPVLLACLQGITGTRKGQMSVPATVSGCAVLLNARRRRANSVQKLIGSLLFQGKAKSQVSNKGY